MLREVRPAVLSEVLPYSLMILLSRRAFPLLCSLILSLEMRVPSYVIAKAKLLDLHFSSNMESPHG